MLKEMVLERNRKTGGVVFMAAAFLCSAFLAYAAAGSSVFTVPAAFAAALPPVYCLSAVVGSVVTYFLCGKASASAMVICSLAIIGIGKWISASHADAKLSGTLAGASTGITGLLFGIIVEHSLVRGIVYVIIGVITGAAALYIYRSIEIAKEDDIKLDKNALTAFSAIYIIIVAILCGFNISVLNVGRIVGVAAVLYAAKSYRHVGGVMCGVLTTAGIFISSSELGLPAAFLGIAGLGAGFVSSYSKVTMSAVLMTVSFLGQLMVGMNDASFCMQADIALGCITFMVTPFHLIKFNTVIAEDEDDSGAERLVKARMDFVTCSLADVRKSVEDMIKVLDKKKVPFSTVDEVSSRICGKCRNKLYCWEDNYNRTNACFIKLEKMHLPDTDSFPTGLDYCGRKTDLIESFVRCRKEENINKMLSARLSEAQSFLFSQMETTEEIISAISDKINFRYSRLMTKRLCDSLDRYSVGFNTAVAYYNSRDRLIAELYTDKSWDEDPEEIAEMLSAGMRVRLTSWEPFSSENEQCIRFVQETAYKPEWKIAQSSANDDEPIGDSCSFFCDGFGYCYMLISDGMGSGKQAAVDSAIVSSIFKRLVKSGIDCTAAIKILNSIMLTKSEDESFATLDVARIDLETCELTLIKSGASSTIIKYPDSVMMFGSPSSPIGIIRNAEPYCKVCNFEESDILVMLSDGVSDSLYSYIKEQLLSECSLEELVNNIRRAAEEKSSGGMRDDITVAALKLGREH